MENFYYNLIGGLNTELTPIVLGAKSAKVYWANAFNVEPYKNQGIIRQKGNQLIFSAADKIKPKAPLAENIDSGHDSTNQNAAGQPQDDLSPVKIAGVVEYPKGGKNFVIAASDGRIFYFDAVTEALNQVFDFNAEISKFIFEYFLDGLVILPVKYAASALDGVYFNLNNAAKTEPLNFKNADGEIIRGTYVCQYASRLWISSGNTLYYSALGTHNDWQTSHDAGYISNFHSSTAEIVTMKEYSGALAVYKKYEVFLLTGNDPESFAIIKFADKGAAGARCVLTCNNKQYFFNEQGLFALSYAGELSQIVMGSNRAKNVLKLLESIDKSRIEDALILPYEAKNQIWIFPPIKGETVKKQVWIYDFELECWFTRVIPYEITCAATVFGQIYTVSNQPAEEQNAKDAIKPYGQTVLGKIYVENTGNTFSGKPIKFSFSTPFFNFSKPTCQKIIEDFEIICDGAVENDFNFSISTDYVTGSEFSKERVQMSAPGVLVWEGGMDSESEYTATIWAGPENSPDDEGGIWKDVLQEGIKLDIFEANKAVQLHFEGTEKGQDLAIIGFEFKNILCET